MAHGLAAEKAFGLHTFAEHFVNEGFAVYVFDYRNFGDSDGEPRNLVNPWRHLTDWRNALQHVRNLDISDNERIILWGTSFSGGHVLRIAAKDTHLAAIITQVPFVDGLSALADTSPMDIAKAFLFGIYDSLRSIIGMSPYYSPVVGKPGDFALLNTPGSWEGYFSLIPDNSNWQNGVPARVLMTIGFYRPIQTVNRIKVPVLVVTGSHDDITPEKIALKAVAKIPNAEHISLDSDHFQVYGGGTAFKNNITSQISFLRKRIIP